MPSTYKLTAIRLHTSDNRTDTYGLARTRGGAHFVMHIATRTPFCTKGHVDDKELLVAFLKNTGGEHGFCRICVRDKRKAVKGTAESEDIANPEKLKQSKVELEKFNFAALLTIITAGRIPDNISTPEEKKILEEKLKELAPKELLVRNKHILSKEKKHPGTRLAFLIALLHSMEEHYEFIPENIDFKVKLKPTLDNLKLTSRFQTISPQPHSVEVKNVEGWGEAKGVFSTAEIAAGAPLGHYSGLVIEMMDDPKLGARKEEYLFDIVILSDTYFVHTTMMIFYYGLVTIDASRDSAGNESINWTGRFNHKWSWAALLEMAGLDSKAGAAIWNDEWADAFSNVRVDEQAEFTTLRAIKKGEQLFFDYGRHYWSSREKPYWLGLPRSLTEYMSAEETDRGLKTAFAKLKQMSITQ